MKHKDEICRWTNYPDGTKVWFKAGSPKWSTTMYPNWEADIKYVVDDEYAEVRKFFIDHGYIYLKGKKITSTLWLLRAEDYSTTREPEWYEKEENIDKLIYVRDNDSQKWRSRIFKQYRTDTTFTFETQKGGVWQQAKLIDESELAK